MLLLSVLGADGPPAPPARSCPSELFRIARSTNANVVVYEARLFSSGALDRQEPVHASWVMLALDGHREELNFLERGLAYGFDAREDGENLELRLRAQPGRPIVVRFRDGCPAAFMTVAGRETILRRIFVQVGGGPFPEVQSVELTGLVPGDGSEVREVVAAASPDDGPRMAAGAGDWQRRRMR